MTTEQATAFVNAINVALHEASSQFSQPQLNAVLGALADRAGASLALVENTRLRKQMYRKVTAEIKRKMIEECSKPNRPTAIVQEIKPPTTESSE